MILISYVNRINVNTRGPIGSYCLSDPIAMEISLFKLKDLLKRVNIYVCLCIIFIGCHIFRLITLQAKYLSFSQKLTLVQISTIFDFLSTKTLYGRSSDGQSNFLSP